MISLAAISINRWVTDDHVLVRRNLLSAKKHGDTYAWRWVWNDYTKEIE